MIQNHSITSTLVLKSLNFLRLHLANVCQQGLLMWSRGTSLLQSRRRLGYEWWQGQHAPPSGRRQANHTLRYISELGVSVRFYSTRVPYGWVMDGVVKFFGDFSIDSEIQGADSYTDRLSNRYTVILLVTFCLMHTSQFYFGAPIGCFCPSHFNRGQVDYVNKVRTGITLFFYCL